MSGAGRGRHLTKRGGQKKRIGGIYIGNSTLILGLAAFSGVLPVKLIDPSGVLIIRIGQSNLWLYPCNKAKFVQQGKINIDEPTINTSAVD